MKFTDLFIKKPILAIVVSLVIFILGLKSVFNLEVRQYPKVENATITVRTAYTGASADVIQGFITTPIQAAISSADGIDYINSTSVQGLSTINAVLRLNADSATAFTDILAKVNSVRNQLPTDALDPVITKSTGSTIALLYVNYSSNKLNFSQLYDFLNRVVQPRLQSVAGVSSVDILGGNPFAMRLWLKPEKMAALNITAEDIGNTILNNNFISAAGQLKGLYTITALDAKTDVHSAEEFQNLSIREHKGKLVRMRDVADVELGSESYSSSVFFNDTKGVFIAINALPTANPLTVIEDVRTALPSLEKLLPPTVEQKIVYDSTKFISASIYDVLKTLLEAAIIVIIVIFLFLGSMRSVIIPVVTIPLSLVGVALVMLFLGYSINLLTLLAMVLAIGLVVDDAIVVVENIHRHIEEGQNPFKAAIMGAREIALPVISMTITLATVYAPIGFMGGLTGALFKEFALTLAASVVVSGVVALTLSPMMCSKLLVHDTNTESFARKLDRIFTKLQNFYEKKLTAVLNYRPIVLFFGAVVFISVFFLYDLTPKELAPVEDQGFMGVLTSAPSYSNLRYMEKYSTKVIDVLSSVPEKDVAFVINGTNGENSGFGGVVYKSWGDRKRTAKQLQPILQNQLNNISGIKAFAFFMPDLPTGSNGLPVQFVLKTTDSYQDLYDISEELRIKAQKSGMFFVVSNDLSFDKSQLTVNVDRNKAAEMNVSMRAIGNTLSTFLGGGYINFFSMQGRSYKIIPQLPDVARYNPRDLEKAYVRANGDNLVPLSNFISYSIGTQPNSLNQFQQMNSATISGFPVPTQTAAAALDFLVKTAKEIAPKGMTFDYSGDSRALVNEGDALLVTFVFALIMIFLVLAAQFESFRDPLVIMISVPMAICGALIPLNIGLATINIYTQIGLVTLIGLITKHGILMVEFANQLRRTHGYSPREAIEKSSSIRLRPILMTTAAMVLGVIPLILASGAGAASRHDIGLVIASGLVIGTLFTLFVVPTMYTYITRKELPIEHSEDDVSHHHS